MAKIYEADRGYGRGTYAAVLGIKGHPLLCAKVFHNTLADVRVDEELVKEYQLARLLYRIGVPVPKPIGIIDIKIPKIISEAWFGVNNDIIKKGFVYQLIEVDWSMSTSEDAWNAYFNAVEQLARNGITSPDLGMNSRSNSTFKNALYCKHLKKIFFIDFEDWKIPLRFKLGLGKFRQ
jgi:hypothetical protein